MTHLLLRCKLRPETPVPSLTSHLLNFSAPLIWPPNCCQIGVLSFWSPAVGLYCCVPRLAVILAGLPSVWLSFLIWLIVYWLPYTSSSFSLFALCSWLSPALRASLSAPFSCSLHLSLVSYWFPERDPAHAVGSMCSLSSVPLLLSHRPCARWPWPSS